jgi:hypothetical protein
VCVNTKGVDFPCIHNDSVLAFTAVLLIIVHVVSMPKGLAFPVFPRIRVQIHSYASKPTPSHSDPINTASHILMTPRPLCWTTHHVGFLTCMTCSTHDLYP